MEGDGKVYEIGGAIGVGKTWLLESAARKGCNTFPEIVIQKQFRDYTKKPEEHAYTFQIAMMQAACMRTVCARLMQDAGKVPTVIERGAQENKVFALANYAMGWMTPEKYALYESYVDDVLSQPQLLPVAGQSVQIFLWAPKHDLGSRMDERARPGEEEYKEDYLLCLDEGYFAYILCSHHEDADENILPYLVIDWRNYGEWEDVMRRVDSREGPAKIYYVEHSSSPQQGKKELFTDNTEAWRIMSEAQLAAEAAQYHVKDPNFLRYRHRGVHKRFDAHGLHLDLSWYMEADRPTHAFALVFYRDLVYEALAMDLPIHFHYRADERSQEAPPMRLLANLRRLGEKKHSEKQQ